METNTYLPVHELDEDGDVDGTACSRQWNFAQAPQSRTWMRDIWNVDLAEKFVAVAWNNMGGASLWQLLER
ncbi:hypothetical protein ACVINI_005056 [Rhizobium beringeri]|jgi:hypothetical protein